MKKSLAILLVAVLVMGVMAGMVSASRTVPYWNISGDWVLDFAGGTENREFLNLQQDEQGNVEGEFWWINNSDVWEYGGTLVGYVSGHSLYLFYDRNPLMNYVGEFEGTINQDGMSGTFTATRPDGTTFGPVTWSTTGSPISLRKDAPAVAVELLKDAEIPHRYGDRKSGGNLIADVAHEMGPESDFRGVSKYDKCAYRYEIAMFLNERIKAEGIEGEVEVPELQYVLHITSVNGNTGFEHHFTIYYNVNTGEGDGTGYTGSTEEYVYDVTLEGDVLSFKATYDRADNYTWYPSFFLNADGTLTFIDVHGPDNVWNATGTWSLTYICK